MYLALGQELPHPLPLPLPLGCTSHSASSSSALVRSWAMVVSISSVKPVVRSSCCESTCATRCESEPSIVSIILTWLGVGVGVGKRVGVGVGLG